MPRDYEDTYPIPGDVAFGQASPQREKNVLQGLANEYQASKEPELAAYTVWVKNLGGPWTPFGPMSESEAIRTLRAWGQAECRVTREVYLRLRDY